MHLVHVLVIGLVLASDGHVTSLHNDGDVTILHAGCIHRDVESLRCIHNVLQTYKLVETGLLRDKARGMSAGGLGQRTGQKDLECNGTQTGRSAGITQLGAELGLLSACERVCAGLAKAVAPPLQCK